MSIWSTTLVFSEDSDESPAPFLHAENREPDADGRGGVVMFAETHDYETERAESLRPFVRVSVMGRGAVRLGDGILEDDEMYVDVTLDDAHVRKMYEYLGEWLRRMEGAL